MTEKLHVPLLYYLLLMKGTPFTYHTCSLQLCKCTVFKISIIYNTRTFLDFFTAIKYICWPFFCFLKQTKKTDFPSLQKSLPRKRPEKSPANSNCFSFSVRFGVSGVLTVVSYMYMSRISSLVSCSIFSTKVCLLALNLLYFRGVQQNKIYKSSSCSSSSLLLVFNDFYIF